MKLFNSGACAALIAVAALAAGCTESPHSYSEIQPSLEVGPARTIEVGESARLAASTHNLVGVKQLKWSVSPNVAKISAESDTQGQTALFTADQPGKYLVTATADMGNGRVISSDTTVTVNGRPIVSERNYEPPRR